MAVLFWAICVVLVILLGPILLNELEVVCLIWGEAVLAIRWRIREIFEAIRFWRK